MDTLRLRVDPKRLEEPESQQAMDRAAAILRGGGTVALPTETVYGLAANALDAAAVAKIFAAKQRPGWDPLIVHVSDAAMLQGLGLGFGETGVPLAAQHRAEALRQAFWPGPLTLLLPRSLAIPDIVTAGRSLVGVRMPQHPVALEVIRRAGVPLAAPSANRFGHTSPTTAQHVLDDLDGRIDAVLDAGPTALGLESTVLDPGESPMVIYRPGAITVDQIRAVAGPAELFAERESFAQEPREALPSPGVGLRHYAPKARLILVEDARILTQSLQQIGQSHPAEQVGVMLPSEFGDTDQTLLTSLSHATVFQWGRWSEPEELAQRLFAGLRFLDAAGCTVILCPVPPADGIGIAIRDRLRKAAWKVENPPDSF